MKSSGEFLEDYRKIVFLNESKAEPGDPGYRTAKEYNEEEGLEPGDPGYAENDDAVNEAWDTDYETPKSKRGMFKGRSQESMKAELNRLKAKKTKTEADKKKEHELVFALRAKNNFGSIKESDAAYLAQALEEGIRIGFDKILKDHHLSVDEFIDGDDLQPELYDALYSYYFDEMPYGVAKSKTGDPFQWVTNQFTKDLEHEGLMHPQVMQQAQPMADVMAVGENKAFKPGPFSKAGFVNEDSWTSNKCKKCGANTTAREVGQPESKTSMCKSCKAKSKKKK